jgi:hypothetical protein
MACALKLLIQKGAIMKVIKRKIYTGIKKLFGLPGSSTGNYQLAILRIKQII